MCFLRKPKNLTNQFLQTRLKTLDWQTVPLLTQMLTSVQFGKATEWPFFFDTTKLFVIILLFLMNSFLNNTATASQQTWALVYHILIHPGMIQIQMLRLVFHYVKMWFSDYGLTHCSYQKPFNLFLFFYSYNFKRLWI